MYAVTPKFLEAIKHSGTRKTVVDVYEGKTKIISDLPVVSGSLKVDRNSRSRRSGSLLIGDPELFPHVTSDILAPYDIEIVIKTGLVYGDNDEELVPLGTFLVNTISADEEEGLFPTIEFFDRAQRVFEHSTHVTDGGPQSIAGFLVKDAIDVVIRRIAPGYPGNPLWGLSIESTLSNPRIPGGMFDGDTDRWQLALDLAQMIGAEVYFDVSGNAVVQAVKGITDQTAEQDAVWIVETGETGTLVSASQSVTREETYNGVLVLGATPDGATRQPRGFVTDTTPTSPTYYLGTFGRKTLRVSNDKLINDSQCITQAKAILKNSLGLAKNVSFGAIANPALDVGDIILLIFPDGSREIHLLDSFDMPLGEGSMSATTRTSQLAVE